MESILTGKFVMKEIYWSLYSLYQVTFDLNDSLICSMSCNRLHFHPLGYALGVFYLHAELELQLRLHAPPRWKTFSTFQSF